MLSINSSPAVSWPTTTGQSVEQVRPVAAVSAAKRSSNESGQQGGDARQTPDPTPSVRVSTSGGASPRESQASDAAPLLPRERPPEEQEAAERAEAAEAEADKAQEAETRARESAQGPQPQQLLSTIWKASGAVVEQALGTDDAQAGAADATTATLPTGEVVVVATAGRMTSAESTAQESRSSEPVRADQEVVAYDESGNGTPAPVELGVIISERV